MHKKISLLSLIILSSVSLSYAATEPFDGIQYVQSEESLSSPLVSSTVSDAAAQLNLLKAHSSLKSMSLKDRNTLAKKLGSTQRIALEQAIPEEQQDAAIEKKSCCLVFWRSCFKISSKTLGSLAIDLILDLSDGKLDGQGPNGSINYLHHVAEIINATMEEVRAA